MKNTVLLFAFILFSFAAKAQGGSYWNVDTSVYYGFNQKTFLLYSDTINFNSQPVITKHIRVDTSGLWQIGTSHKTAFGSSAGIMTDTVNPYPAKSNAYIELHELAQYNGERFMLLFRHRYDIDSLHAGGSITISLDSGKTYRNILSDSNILNLSAGNFYYSYGQNGKDSCFEGTTSGWVTTLLLWEPWINLPDSFRIRFNFNSDTSANHTKAGWCIQYIKYSITLTEGVQDITTLPIKTYPNPCTDAEYIDLRKLPTGTLTQLQVNDMLGRTIYTNAAPQGYVTIDTHTWAQGMYIVKLMTADGKTYTHKITKQ